MADVDIGDLREKLGYREAQLDALDAQVKYGDDGLILWLRHGKNWRDLNPMFLKRPEFKVNQ